MILGRLLTLSETLFAQLYQKGTEIPAAEVLGGVGEESACGGHDPLWLPWVLVPLVISIPKTSEPVPLSVRCPVKAPSRLCFMHVGQMEKSKV